MGALPPAHGNSAVLFGQPDCQQVEPRVDLNIVEC